MIGENGQRKDLPWSARPDPHCEKKRVWLKNRFVRPRRLAGFSKTQSSDKNRVHRVRSQILLLVSRQPVCIEARKQKKND